MVKYTGEDKLAAIQRYLGGNEIATSIGISDSVIRNWVIYKEHGMELSDFIISMDVENIIFFTF